MSSLSGEDDNLAELVEHFGSRLFLVFSYFFFEIEFKKDKEFIDEFVKEPGPDIIRGLRVGTIQAACLNTTLLTIRDIDDFLKPRSRETKSDDVKASDLGYNEGLEFLTKSERERINKIIMHSTVTAVKNYDASWDIQELISKCVSQSLHFLNWVILNYPGEKHPKVWAAAIKNTELIKMILTYAKRVSAKKAS
jgi:hypothetical protein